MNRCDKTRILIPSLHRNYNNNVNSMAEFRTTRSNSILDTPVSPFRTGKMRRIVSAILLLNVFPLTVPCKGEIFTSVLFILDNNGLHKE